MRVDKPTGTWLLLLPCWWGVALSADYFPNLWLMLLFAIGAIVMRGAGCVVNDIYDRRLDRLVERTRTRPLGERRDQPVSGAGVSRFPDAVGLWHLASFQPQDDSFGRRVSCRLCSPILS